MWAKSDDHRTRRESKLEAKLAARNTMSLYLLHINSMLAICTRIINMPRGNGTGELLHAADRAVLKNEQSERKTGFITSNWLIDMFFAVLLSVRRYKLIVIRIGKR